MKKAIGYIRVSTSEQAMEGVSLDNQKAKIQSYCQFNDLELMEIIEDAGKSGKDLKREGIQALIGRIRDKSVDAVVVYKLDRLSRKVIDTITLIEAFEKSGITFHSLNEKIDTGTAMGRFFLNITASLAQMERDLISERTRDALQMKIANHRRAGQIPYGWRLTEDRDTLIQHQEAQEAISLIKRLQGSGYSLRAICRALSMAGYKPVGKKWHPQTVKNILKRVA
jgi:DNA invertase Pin-like site-specific DNA recombinase